MLSADDADGRNTEAFEADVQVRRFEDCGSSSLELRTFLWAVEAADAAETALTVFTDSQTIVGLSARRERLEAAGFCSRSGRLLSQGELYRKFFDALDRRRVSFVKVKGHRKESDKSREDRLFTLVDRASRAALRKYLKGIAAI